MSLDISNVRVLFALEASPDSIEELEGCLGLSAYMYTEKLSKAKTLELIWKHSYVINPGEFQLSLGAMPTSSIRLSYLASPVVPWWPIRPAAFESTSQLNAYIQIKCAWAKATRILWQRAFFESHPFTLALDVSKIKDKSEWICASSLKGIPFISVPSITSIYP